MIFFIFIKFLKETSVSKQYPLVYKGLISQCNRKESAYCAGYFMSANPFVSAFTKTVLYELLQGSFHMKSDHQLTASASRKHVTQVAKESFCLQLIWWSLNFFLWSAVNRVGSMFALFDS